MRVTKGKGVRSGMQVMNGVQVMTALCVMRAWPEGTATVRFEKIGKRVYKSRRQ